MPVGEGEIDALVEAMERARVGRPEMARAALRLAGTEHGLDRVADLYAAALRRGRRARARAAA